MRDWPRRCVNVVLVWGRMSLPSYLRFADTHEWVSPESVDTFIVSGSSTLRRVTVESQGGLFSRIKPPGCVRSGCFTSAACYVIVSSVSVSLVEKDHPIGSSALYLQLPSKSTSKSSMVTILHSLSVFP